jgi:hypothetical protein
MRAALLLMASGCSFGLTQPPRPHKPCTTSDTAPIIDTVTAVGLAALSVVIVADSGDDYAQSNSSAYATMTGVSAFIYTIAATRGWGNIRSCRDHQIIIEHERELAERSKVPPPAPDTVWRLSRLASAAARDGNCAAVTGIGRALQQIDSDFHDNVFMRDEAITACLALPKQTRTPGTQTESQPQPESQLQPEPQPQPQQQQQSRPQPQPQQQPQAQPQLAPPSATPPTP